VAGQAARLDFVGEEEIGAREPFRAGEGARRVVVRVDAHRRARAVGGLDQRSSVADERRQEVERADVHVARAERERPDGVFHRQLGDRAKLREHRPVAVVAHEVDRQPGPRAGDRPDRRRIDAALGEGAQRDPSDVVVADRRRQRDIEAEPRQPGGADRRRAAERHGH
jgi:hypothetical protein